MADRYLCACGKVVTATANNRYRTHVDLRGGKCPASSEPIPEHILAAGPETEKKNDGVPKEGVDFATCPQCGRKVKLTHMGVFHPHDTTLKGGESCPVSGVSRKNARKQEDVLLPGDVPASPAPRVKDSSTPAANQGLATDLSVGQLDRLHQVAAEPRFREVDWSEVGDLKYLPDLAPAAESGASTETSSPESSTILTPSPSPQSVETLGTATGRFLQPGSPFLQPPAYTGPVKPEPMGDLAKQLATQIKETFYSYSNRKTSDNRSAQVTLGPSEIGTPCDRRLAMSLMGIPAVNPGGDGWAAFVGTCGHVGMGEIYTFADAGTGRYAVEMRVNLGNPLVPKGTTDLLDRRDATIVDWKFMGKYSLDKFRLNGPSDTHRIQVHTYGYGAERGGEKVKNVAVVGLPRAGGSLDEMHVWTEKYDKKIALAALDRVEKIAQHVTVGQDGTQEAKAFATGDDCRYCPFFLKGDKEMNRGCPGR